MAILLRAMAIDARYMLIHLRIHIHRCMHIHLGHRCVFIIMVCIYRDGFSYKEKIRTKSTFVRLQDRNGKEGRVDIHIKIDTRYMLRQLCICILMH